MKALEDSLEKHENVITIAALFLAILAAVAYGVIGHLLLLVSLALFLGSFLYLGISAAVKNLHNNK